MIRARRMGQLQIEGMTLLRNGTAAPRRRQLMTKLRPCLFCHHCVLTTDQERDEWYVTCGTCHARGPICSSYDSARSAWNGWNPQPIPSKALKKLFGSMPDLPENEMCWGCGQLQDNCECKIIEREVRKERTDDTK